MPAMVCRLIAIGGKVKLSSGYTHPPPLTNPRRVVTGLSALPKIRSSEFEITKDLYFIKFDFPCIEKLY
jgi:hypothetical protein